MKTDKKLTRTEIEEIMQEWGGSLNERYHIDDASLEQEIIKQKPETNQRDGINLSATTCPHCGKTVFVENKQKG